MNAASSSNPLKRAVKRGYTVLELVMIILIVAVLAAYSWTSFQGTDEARDAAMVQSAQAALQSIVSQGSARSDLPPDQLQPGNVLNALNASFSTTGNGSSVKFSLSGSDFLMSIPNNGRNRSARFHIGANGDVNLLNLSNFTDYTVQNGVIFKP
jgi:type II secretory pathway pseudopilin PulG